jgi:glycosyltransferase involved in cell wall biosynthesis
MRIARVLTRLNLGGPARQVLASDPILKARGHDVIVFAGEPEPGEGDLSDELRSSGVEVHRVPGLRRGLSALFGDDGKARRHLGRALADWRPDVVHTHASKAGAIGRRAARRSIPDVPTVHTFHGHVLEGYFPAPISFALRRLEAHLARSTTQVLAVSEATRADLGRLGVAQVEQIEVCQPGIQLDAFLRLPELTLPNIRESTPLRRSLSIPPSAPVVGVIGRLAPVKRTTLAVDVFAAVAKEFPDAHLLIAGDGAERERVEAKLRRLPESISRRVSLLGAVQDVAPIHEAMDVLLSTSFTEGMPVAMIEAAAAGRPVISTAVGGVPELVQNGVTGLLAVDRDGLAAAISGLFGGPEEAQGMGRRARERVQELHSAEALATRLEETYGRWQRE